MADLSDGLIGKKGRWMLTAVSPPAAIALNCVRWPAGLLADFWKCVGDWERGCRTVLKPQKAIPTNTYDQRAATFARHDKRSWVINVSEPFFGETFQ